MRCFLFYWSEQRSVSVNEVRGIVWSTLGHYRPLSRTDISVSNISSIIGVIIIHILYIFFFFEVIDLLG